MPFPLIIALILAAILLALLALCLFLARFLVFPPRPSFEETLRFEEEMNYLRGYDDTAGEKYTVSSFDGYEIHAELLRAPEPSDRCVILSHGYSYDRHGSVKYTHLFRPLGFNCIIYDSRGHGLNKKAPCAFGETEKNDLFALINDCRSRFGFTHIGLHGESMGSALTALCLGENPPVDFAVLDCGYADFRSVIEGKLKSFRLPKVLIYPVEMICRLLYRVSIFRPRPAEALKKSAVPLCIIHGESDSLIPVSHAYRLYEAAAGEKEIHTFPGADHAKSFLTDEERYGRILHSFINKVYSETNSRR